MPKPALIAAGVVAVVVVIGGVMLVTNKKDSTNIDSGAQQSSSSQASNNKIKDPNGDYKLFSDPSITKPPTKDEVLGGGKAISIEYDGSKSKDGSSLFYKTYYIDKDNEVRMITGSSFSGITKGTFTTSDKVFDSSADGRPGFLEVYIIKAAATDPSAGGPSALDSTPIKLGMYAIKLKSD